MWNFLKRKNKPVASHWHHIPFLDKEGYGYAINPDGVIMRISDKTVMPPYPYPKEFGGRLVCLAVDKFFVYIDGPALADVIFDKPGSDASRRCVFLTGYKYIKE